MHVGRLAERVLRIIGDVEGNRYGIGEIGTQFNEAQRKYLRETRTVLRAEATLVVDATQNPDTAFYTKPSDFLSVESLKVDDRPALRRLTVQQAERLYANWRAEAGDPLYWLDGYWDGLFRLVPYPTTAVDPVLSYVRRPRDLRVSLEPDVPHMHQDFLVHEAAAWILVNDEDFYDQAKADYHGREALTILEQAKAETPLNNSREHRSVRFRKY